MTERYSSNAVLTKARAMYGRHLTKHNFSDLLSCHSVSEVAYYLKNNTVYRKLLKDVNESEIHRGRLEQFLRRKMFEDVAALCIYDATSGERFSTYMVLYAEIGQIMHAVTFLASASEDDYIFSMPVHLSHMIGIDLQALSRISSFSDLLEVLEHTPYRRLLEPFRPVEGGGIDYTGIEKTLYTYLYGRVYEIIAHLHSKGAKKELVSLFDAYIDMENYLRIRRLKLNYHASPDYIRSCLFPFGSVSGKRLNEAIKSDKPEEFGKPFRLLRKASSVPALAEQGTLRQSLMYGKCLHNLRFSVYPSVVMLSYFFLMEIEIQDIITIIEGIRYTLPQSEIAALLTIINFSKAGGE